MHISEGVLAAPVLLSSGVISAIGTYIGLKKIDPDDIMPAAMLSSAFFVAGLVHVPIGPGSAHLMLIGLLGIMLGWIAFPAILTALFLQVLFFQFDLVKGAGVIFKQGRHIFKRAHFFPVYGFNHVLFSPVKTKLPQN